MSVRNVLAALALAGGLLAAVLGSSRPDSPRLDMASAARDIERGADHVSAIQLAEWIRARKQGLRVIDLRSDSEFAEVHIPSASRVALAELPSINAKPGETIVLYSATSAVAAQAWLMSRAMGTARVYYLRGGAVAWADDVLSPVLPESATTPAVDSAARRIGDLSRYFGGIPLRGTGPALVLDDERPTVLSRIRRRGC